MEMTTPRHGLATLNHKESVVRNKLIKFLAAHGVAGTLLPMDRIRVLTAYSVPRGSQRVLQYQWETINATYADVRAYLGY